MAEPTEAELQRASKLLDTLTFGGHSHDGAQRVLAQALATARNSDEQVARTTAAIEEAAVFDFLNWLTAQNLQIVFSDDDYSIHSISQPGILWERWKMERHL